MNQLVTLAPKEFNPQHDESVFERGLPKWPQMRVEGVPVSIEQAKEIIRRTDTYFQHPEWSGNDRNYCSAIMRKLEIPDASTKPDGTKYVGSEIGEAWERRSNWLYAWGFIETEYVHNTWISSSFVYGPHGWCHPDGTISFIDNVGKWPSVKSIYDDWCVLAREFPFLHLGVVLMDREQCEENPQPVAGFYVREGNVIAFAPEKYLTMDNLEALKANRSDDEFVFRGTGYTLQHERGIPWQWIEEWASRPRSLNDGIRTDRNSL